jgi:adenosylhomocysteine nucleosidase
LKPVLLFIAAEPREFAGFLPHVANLETAELPVHWSRRGNWKNHDILLVANGAGPAQSGAAVKACDSATAIINAGFCGALDSDLKVGEVIVADKVFFSTQMFDCRSVTTSARFRQGAICSSARVAATAGEKEYLRRSGAIAVEMEAGGIIPYAQDHGLPFFCVRVVSDLADESFSNDFNAALGPDGRYRLGRLIGSALMQPHRRVPELIRLKQRCDLAAVKLGEFLDSCSF